MLIRDIAFGQAATCSSYLSVPSPIGIRLSVLPLDSSVAFLNILLQLLPRLDIQLRPAAFNAKQIISKEAKSVNDSDHHTKMMETESFTNPRRTNQERQCHNLIHHHSNETMEEGLKLWSCHSHVS